MFPQYPSHTHSGPKPAGSILAPWMGETDPTSFDPKANKPPIAEGTHPLPPALAGISRKNRTEKCRRPIRRWQKNSRNGSSQSHVSGRAGSHPGLAESAQTLESHTPG